MKDTLILTKILLKNSLNKNVSKNSLNFKEMLKKLIMLLAVIYIACIVAFLSKSMLEVVQKINQQEIFITLCLIITIIETLFQSILSSLNILYFSKDIESLLPLPVSPIQIIFSKFNVMLISEYIIQLITFVIPFGVYGVVTGQEPIFYLMSLLVFLFLPTIPTMIGVLFTTILVRVTNVLKNKDIVQYLTVGITFVIVIAMQFYMMQAVEMTDFMLANKLSEINGISNYIADYFIILKQAIISLTELNQAEGIRNILFLVAESLTAYSLVAILISKAYINIAVNRVSGKSIKKAVNIKSTSKTVGKAYITKEFKLLLRTPTFFLNVVLPILIFPMFFAIPIFNFFNTEDVGTIMSSISAISVELQNTTGFALCLCAINFLYMLNYISVTTISREGENAIFMKYIPIELHKQCRYKAVPSIILNMYPLILVITAMKLIFRDMNTMFLAEVFIVAFLNNVLFSYCSILIDVLNPKLHWNSEYVVIKQNLNMLWDTIFILIASVITFGICSFFEQIEVVVLLLSAIILLTLSFYDRFIDKNSINIFSKIN